MNSSLEAAFWYEDGKLQSVIGDWQTVYRLYGNRANKEVKGYGYLPGLQHDSHWHLMHNGTSKVAEISVAEVPEEIRLAALLIGLEG